MKKFDQFNEELAESFDNNSANELLNQLNHKFSRYTWGADKGKFNIKIWRITGDDEMSKSVAAFVDKRTGIIYKAAGWKKPSKTIMGNLSDLDSLFKVMNQKLYIG